MPYGNISGAGFAPVQGGFNPRQSVVNALAAGGATPLPQTGLIPSPGGTQGAMAPAGQQIRPQISGAGMGGPTPDSAFMQMLLANPELAQRLGGLNPGIANQGFPAQPAGAMFGTGQRLLGGY